MNNRLTAEEIFHATREKSDPAERAGFLDGACGQDVSLRAKVEALLKADAEAGSFLSEGTQSDDPDATIPHSGRRVSPRAPVVPFEQAGDMIGRYKLLEQIGEGGFGSVWMAEQREPVKRRVALKVIKLGMDTRQVIARFEAERQALAMMDHPNIAKVLDAGSTESGRLYFVMEYIKGVSILEYCDTDKLDTKARLELFSRVCHAIQHAHQKGIIHRDIKPNNVLITMHDGVPVPKVIDFGIAKATSAELTARTLFTEHRQMIGTPAYMSPEQAEMSGLDIDTRSDIYSLGVLLYELLTGTTPFDSKELMSKGFAEMMRIIREVEPHKPSTRLSSLGDTGTRTAQQRRAVDPKKLSQGLKGDLDWIVMKCLEKDRTRRYETANSLGMDIRRHLGGEAVVAAPPSTAYRLKKLVRRNRGQVIAAGAVVVALLIGVIAFAWQAKVARDQRDLAVQAQIAEAEQRKQADAARAGAQMQEAEAKKQAASAMSISRFLQDMLMKANPFESGDRNMTVVELLDQASSRAAEQLASEPNIEADVRRTIGTTYRDLGLLEEGERELRRAVELGSKYHGEEHALVADTLHALFWLLIRAGKYDDAEAVGFRALAIRRRLYGEEHVAVADSLDSLGDLYRSLGDLRKAIPLLRQAQSIYRNLSVESPTNMSDLAQALLDDGDLKESEALLRSAIESSQRQMGAVHPHTYRYMGNLGLLLLYDSRFAEAEEILSRTCEMSSSRLGPTHYFTLTVLHHHSEALARLGRLEEAERAAIEAVNGYRNSNDFYSQESAHALSILGMVQIMMSKHQEAEITLREALELRMKSSPNSWRMGETRRLFGAALAGQGKFLESETTLLKAYQEIKGRATVRYAERETIERIVDAYNAWNMAEPGKGYDAKAAEWKAKLNAAAP